MEMGEIVKDMYRIRTSHLDFGGTLPNVYIGKNQQFGAKILTRFSIGGLLFYLRRSVGN